MTLAVEDGRYLEEAVSSNPVVSRRAVPGGVCAAKPANGVARALRDSSSQREIAAALGVSQSAVSQQLKAARDLSDVHPEVLLRAASLILVDVARP